MKIYKIAFLNYFSFQIWKKKTAQAEKLVIRLSLWTLALRFTRFILFFNFFEFKLAFSMVFEKATWYFVSYFVIKFFFV